jgi:hypothetical protein
MDSFIIPNVEFSIGDIPSKVFFRKSKRIFLKVSDSGITFSGKSLNWEDFKKVSIKFFNGNPYIQFEVAEQTYSFYFENKFYFRKKAPWFGASEFKTKEFVKVLEEKNLLTVDKLYSNVESNNQSPFIHTLWNSMFFIIPPVLFIASIAFLYAGLIAGT